MHCTHMILGKEGKRVPCTTSKQQRFNLFQPLSSPVFAFLSLYLLFSYLLVVHTPQHIPFYFLFYCPFPSCVAQEDPC